MQLPNKEEMEGIYMRDFGAVKVICRVITLIEFIAFMFAAYMMPEFMDQGDLCRCEGTDKIYTGWIGNCISCYDDCFPDRKIYHERCIKSDTIPNRGCNNQTGIHNACGTCHYVLFRRCKRIRRSDMCNCRHLYIHCNECRIEIYITGDNERIFYALR